MKAKHLETVALNSHETALFYFTERHGVECYLCIIIDQNDQVVDERMAMSIQGLKQIIFTRNAG